MSFLTFFCKFFSLFNSLKQAMASDDVMSACMDGNHKLLKTQLAFLHLDANEADDEGVTPLYIASGT
jgi:hypothetical protein